MKLQDQWIARRRRASARLRAAFAKRGVDPVAAARAMTREKLDGDGEGLEGILTRLADVLGIDPLAAAKRKMVINARKYPVHRARGNARKYNAR